MPYLYVHARNRLASVNVDNLSIENKVNALLAFTYIAAEVFTSYVCEVVELAHDTL
jgi:hypothetical protein